MRTSSTDPSTLLVFVGEDGAPGCWLRLGDGAAEYGVAADGLPAAGRHVLAVPGEQVAVHWLDLEPGLTRAQAAAAARLMLADASAEPMSELHVAVGRPEQGLTPVALLPSARLSGWLAAASFEPDAVVPSPLLLAPPQRGYVRREVGALSDYRGPAAAFTIEPELASAIVGDAPVETVDEAAFEAALPAILAEPPLDLRQGPFATRRRWRIESQRTRRLAALALLLGVLTLGVQVAAILSYTFAADRLEAEADSLAGGGAAGGPGFSAAATALFEAVRATPNIELTRLQYRADGSLAATVTMDSPATLAALQGRLEQSGLVVEPGARRNAGGRPTADFTVRAA